MAGGPAANFTADHDGRDDEPAWSPDGNQIAFFSDRDGGGIYVMPAIGGPSNRISPRGSAEGQISPQWSSDGAELAHIRREEQGSFIEIVSLRTRESRRLRIPGDSGNSRLRSDAARLPSPVSPAKPAGYAPLSAPRDSNACGKFDSSLATDSGAPTGVPLSRATWIVGFSNRVSPAPFVQSAALSFSSLSPARARALPLLCRQAGSALLPAGSSARFSPTSLTPSGYFTEDAQALLPVS